MNSNFIDLFCEFTKEFESPLSFWKWSAYAGIAATLRFNCYIKWGTSNLYPNLYVLLLADSAAYRKDAGPELISDLLKEHAHTKVISGRASWQGIIDTLSQDIGNKKTGVPIKDGAAIIVATEFTAAFVEDASLIKNMTEGYTYSPEFVDTLRGGTVKVKNRCITLLGGSNETLLRDIFSVKATYGGLLRRTCLIKPDNKRAPNSLFEDNKKNYLDLGERKLLIDELRKVSNLKGEFTFDPVAKLAFKDWYHDLYNSYDKYDDRTGFIQGVHTIIVKIAMIKTAAQNSLIIDEKIISSSIKEVMNLKENYTTYVMGTGKNPHANMGAVILDTLWKNHLNNNGSGNLKRRDILLKYWNEISGEDLDKLLSTMEQAQLITMIPVGSEPSYCLTLKAQELFLKSVQSKSKAVN